MMPRELLTIAPDRGIERRGDISRSAALTAITGYKKPGVRHRMSQLRKLLRIGGADNRSHGA